MNDAPEAAGTAVANEPAWSPALLAKRLVEARRGGVRIRAERILSAVKTSDEAYRVQAMVDALLWPGVDATVWKAGADTRESLPTAAPIPPALVYADGGEAAADAFGIRIVEAEIAYRFGADLPSRAVPYTTDEVTAAIASMHVAIEVVDPRIADFGTASPLAKLADHLLNGAFVLGVGVEAWRKLDLRQQKATLSLAGKLQQSVEGSHGLGNPAVLLPWFVAHLGRLPTWDADGNPAPPRGVRAGDVVTTGSWTRVVEAAPGQRVDVVFDGIGQASLVFSGPVPSRS